MDLEILARHVQFPDKLISTPSFSDQLKPKGRRIPKYTFAGGKDMGLEEAKKLVRETAISNYNPACTCAMGKRENGGVVSERLRVRGVKNLKVVDASVFPLMSRGNIITSVYAIAERRPDLIKEDGNGK
jgi:choline dehydrogenase-like flavoprotein